jgi:hypothetical protein
VRVKYTNYTLGKSDVKIIDEPDEAPAAVKKP